MSHYGNNPSTVSPERMREVETIVQRVTAWATKRSDIVGLLLVGSYARNAARPGSDIDLVILTGGTKRYSDNAWADELSLGPLIATRSWGPVVERRFITTTGLEVEINLARPDWAGITPVDPGTQKVVTDGAHILYDPAHLLANLVRACRH